jgi:hypothetical protein
VLESGGRDDIYHPEDWKEWYRIAYKALQNLYSSSNLELDPVELLKSITSSKVGLKNEFVILVSSGWTKRKLMEFK